MASIQFNNFKIDIEVQNIDGAFQEIFGVPFQKGFWVLLTIMHPSGEKETFPRIDEHLRIKTFSTYEEAIEDISSLLQNQFKESN